jgi:hypothetical protein
VTSALIDAAVTTLMHDRLRILHDALVAKQSLDAFGGSDQNQPQLVVDTVISGVERQVRELARRALALLESGERAPVAPGAPRTQTPGVGTPPVGTSKHAFLGSSLLDLPAFSDLYARRRHWISQVLHGGSPDPSLARVVTPAMDVAFRAVDQGVAAAGDDRSREAVRAAGIGLMGAIASNVIVGPLLRGGEGIQVRDGDWPNVSPEQLRRVESAVRTHVFGGISTDDLRDYWPSVSRVPDAVLSGFLRGLEAPGGPLATPRPLGFADLERMFSTGAKLDERALRSAYRLFRNGHGDWGWVKWSLWLFLFSVPVAAVLPIAASIDKPRWKPRSLFRPGTAPDPSDEAWSQLSLLSLGLSWIGPAVATLWVKGDLPEMSGDFWLAAVGALLDIVGLVLLVANVRSDEAWSRFWRWAPVIAIALWHAISAYRAFRADTPPQRRFRWLHTFPLISTALTLGVALLANKLTEDGDENGDPWRSRILWAWPIVLFGAQVITSLVYFSGRNPLSWLTTGAVDPFPRLDDLIANDPPWARAAVLDESTMWSAATPPTIDSLRYPPGSSRAAVELWWTGSDELQIRHAGHQLWFRLGDGGTPQELSLPPVNFTSRELADWLAAHVTGRPPATPGPAGGLLAVPPLDDTSPEATYRLPWPQIVGEQPVFQKVGRNRAQAYRLPLATRSELATLRGQHGPATSVTEGWPIAPGPGLAGADGTGVGIAAELGVLLSLGAASRMHDGSGSPAGVAIPAAVNRVFRRWNLDARRVNEWRLLVEGGAAPETAPGAPPSPTAAVESVANQLGWLPLFRAWSRIATDVEQDASSDQPAPYNPRVRAADGRWIQPTNRQLSDAIRFLLDL